ncbi:MAG: hypothetical protein DMG69_02245 [Acidobacteria bacterium]|nr:MAG: hypothetical protein DMG69_02245 [Acidobacteriota bacterium]
MNNRSKLGFVLQTVLLLLAMLLLPAFGYSQLSRTAIVRRVAIQGSKQAPEVAITSSEPITPQLKVLTGPDRVVIDFPGALPGDQVRSMAVNCCGIKRVRVGLFEATPPITRVVLDLTAPSKYQVSPSGNTVIVKLGDTLGAAKAGNVPHVSASRPVPRLAPRIQGSSQDYTASADRVKQALRHLGAYSGGHLPTVDGFARPDIEQLERYERPFYRYRVEVKAIDTAHTIVNVTANLSAWFNDPNPSQSGYRSLPSNGRLEGDLLARVQDALQVEKSTLTSDSAPKHSALPSSLSLPAPVSTAPADVASKKAKTEAAAASEEKDGQDQDLRYWVIRQEVHPFDGEWSRLKGKSALFVFAKPRGLLSDMVPDERKVLFLKRVFADSYEVAMHSPNSFQGVVVIFVGGRGAIAAATLTDIRQWMGGGLPDDAFIKRCSLDPPAEFPRPAHTE